MEEGEEADEDDVPSLLSLEQTNGGGADHLLLGEVMTSLVFKTHYLRVEIQSSFTQDENGSDETLIGGLNDLQGLSLADGGGGVVGGGGNVGNTENLLDF